MIASLHIRDFRLFRDLKVPRLGRLNLFVGENSTGKSCLLEAINLYAGVAPGSDLLQMAALRARRRVNPWEPETLIEEGTSLRHPIFDLFHWTGQTVVPEFAIGQIEDLSPLRVRQALHYLTRDEHGLPRYIPADHAGGVVSQGMEVVLSVYRGQRQTAMITRERVSGIAAELHPERQKNGQSPGLAFLSASGLAEEAAAAMWDALVQGPGQDLVLEWLRILDSRVEDLVYVGGGRDARVALLKLHGLSRVPLRSLGDGLSRLFQIALAAASASRGVLLVDEFENGLHWSVQTKLWCALAEAASRFDVQMFCTTHSRDCIQGFVTAAASAGPDGALIYRLERPEGDLVATELPLANVEAAVRRQVEIR